MNLNNLLSVVFEYLVVFFNATKYLVVDIGQKVAGFYPVMKIISSLEKISRNRSQYKLYVKFCDSKNCKYTRLSRRDRIKVLSELGDLNSVIEKYQYIHSNFSTTQDDFLNKSKFTCFLCWIYDETDQLSHLNGKREIEKSTSNITDPLNLEDTNTKQFYTIYHTIMNTDENEKELESGGYEDQPPKAWEKIRSQFTSKYYSVSKSDKQHSEILDNLEIQKELSRLLDSDIDMNSLFKFTLGTSYENIEEEIRDSYELYFIVNTNLFGKNDYRQELLKQFEYTFSMGGVSNISSTKSSVNMPVNYIGVAEKGLTKEKVLRRCYKVTPKQSDWSDNTILLVMSGDVEDIDIVQSSGVNDEYNELLEIWKEISNLGGSTYEIMGDELKSALSLREILVVLPISFVNPTCPEKVKRIFLSNHLKMCQKYEIHSVEDWSNNTNAEEITSFLVKNSDISEENIKPHIEDVYSGVEDLVEKLY